MRFFVFAMLVLSLLRPAAAYAQLCIGLPGNRLAPFNLTGLYQHVGSVEGFGGRIGVGGMRAFFGVSGIRSNTKRSQSQSLPVNEIGVDGGIMIQNSRGTTALCPMFSGGYTDGPNGIVDGRKQSASRSAGAIGFAVGTALAISPDVAFVPNARVLFGRVHRSITDGGFGLTNSGSNEILSVGTTLRLRQIVAVGVDARVDFAAIEPEPVLTAFASVGIPRH